MKTIIEPFRIKSVEPIRMTTRAEREAAVAKAGFNLFGLASRDVVIDLLTDSGTGAMSSEQWAAIMRGDESYAGAPSFARFEAAVRETTGLPHVIPTHQGRAAEHLLFPAVAQPGQIVPNNTHFDTTRANIELAGAIARDLPCAASRDMQSLAPFKGDVDLSALERCLDEHRGDVPLVMVTITNNAGGGQPVSLANLRGVRALCDRFEVPLFLDACRFAETAYLVQQRERGERGRTIAAIARSMFDLADGCTMSAKKDGLANIGGFVACRDSELADELRTRLVVTEGFPTYGGLAGRDLDAIAQGLREVVEQDYQEYRHASIRYVVERLADRGVPVLLPAGGHAIFLDAERFLPHLGWREYPGQALAIELYVSGGLRACEIGSVMLGRIDAKTGEELRASHELVRLAIPRRTYTQSHMDYVIEVVEEVWNRRGAIPGVRIVEAPRVLRHFRARFARLPAAKAGTKPASAKKAKKPAAGRAKGRA
ncbi:MAG: tryptophanase [Planctomycetes bacterium]|nr:tryptophanase [Planctomycetota bacterium]